MSRRDLPSRRAVGQVFLFTFVLYAYFMPRWADWNIDSRFDLSRAIVDHRTLRINQYHQNTWDKAIVGSHLYSDKAPGTALLGAGVYAVFKVLRGAPLSGGAIRSLERNDAWNTAIRLGRANTQNQPAKKGTNLGGCERAGPNNVQIIPWGNRLVPPFQDWALSKYVVTIFVDALGSAAFVAFFFWFLGFFALRRRIALITTGLYAFATVALPYSTVFYSHQLVAGSLFTGFALLLLYRRGMVRTWVAAVAGFLLGFSILTEYTVALIVVVLGFYGVWILRSRWRDLSALVLAGTLPVGVLMVYNYACFGGPLDTGYTHDWCWSAAQSAGYAGFTYPQMGPLFDLTVGSFRGLFYASPFLLLAVLGAAWMLRQGYSIEAWICLGISAGFILAISAYWGWNGGKVDGPRYLVPIVPFLALPASVAINRLTNTISGVLAVSFLALWSAFATWSGFLGGELFPVSSDRNPLFNYSLPMLLHNEIAPNVGLFFGLHGWLTLLPLVALLVIIALPARLRPRRTLQGAPATLETHPA